MRPLRAENTSKTSHTASGDKCRLKNLNALLFRGGCGTATRGAARICDEALGRSTVAHFARKVRGANIVAAKHELKIQQSHASERWSCSLRVRGPHFASKVSYNAGPQQTIMRASANLRCEGATANLDFSKFCPLSSGPHYNRLHA